MRELGKRWWAERHGFGLDTLLVGTTGIFFMVGLILSLTTISWLYAAKQHVVQAITVAARQAMYDSVSNATLAQSDSGNINPTMAATDFENSLPQALGWPSSAYTVEDVTVYRASQTGTPLPVGLSGNVAGPSLYAQVAFTFSVVPFGNPKASPMTVPMTVQMVVPANRYNQPEANWVGG